MFCFTWPTLADDLRLQQELDTRIRPLLANHCLDCHSGAEPDAGLSLDHFEKPLDFLKGRKVWEKVVQKVELEEMPPPDSSEISADDRKLLVEWIRGTIENFECGLAPQPGRVTLRRLNANEYQNTVRDLLGVNYSPAANFPGDDVGYGFDNIGDVLTLPPLLMEKYFLAAEEISRYVIKSPPAAKLFTASYAGGQLESERGRGDSALTLASAGDASIVEELPWAGPYLVRVSAAGDQAGDEPVMMGVYVDDKPTSKIAIKNTRGEPGDFEIPLRLRSGKRKISFRFLNDFYVEGKNGAPNQDRNLIIEHVEIRGQRESNEKLDPTKLTSMHRSILKMREDKKSDEDISRQVFTALASRAYRRPVSDNELQALLELVEDVRTNGGSLEESLQVGLQALLVSPKFLFRVEPPRGASESLEGFRELDDFELATRLSYFLWSSMPDAELLQIAWKGKLRESDQLERQIARMIRDPRSNAFVENFAGQWLTLRKLRDCNPNSSMFPKWNDSIRDLVRRETLTFFAGVMRRDMSVLRLLDADFTYLNQELAEYYGIRDVKGTEFREVSLAGKGRAGLLTQASILAVTSNPTRTSPVKRGKWILDNLLAMSPPPAPPGVPELEKSKLTGTLRERMEQHRADPACANCHKLMDPLGFALENFDAVGAYRTEDEGQPIDPSGLMADGTPIKGAAELQRVLVEKHQHDFVECLTEKMLTYALGRGLEYYDKCAVDKIIDEMRKNDYKFSTMLIQIVKSDPFQKKGEREAP